MAAIKSAFSAGAGKVKEVAGLQYNDAAGGSLVVTLPISSNAATTGAAITGTAITGTSLSAGVGLATAGSLNINSASVAATSFAISTTSAGGGNTALATAGYVDAQVSVIASGVSLQAFTVASATGLAVGNVVCLGAGTNAPLKLADKDTDLESNAIGVIKTIVGLVVTVQLDAEIAVSSLAGSVVGDPMFVGDAGAVVPYSGLAAGDFATQVGYVSNVSANKIVIVLKTFGELA
jgi:hypothetical protein